MDPRTDGHKHRGVRGLRARWASVALLLTLGWALTLGSANAATYPVHTGNLTVSTGSLSPGSTVTLTGAGFQPGGSVSVLVFSTPQQLATTVADATGAISVTVTLPSDLPSGTHTVQAVGPAPDGGTTQLSVSFTVAGAASGGALASTGTPVVAITATAVLLLVAGALVLLAGRRRRRA